MGIAALALHNTKLYLRTLIRHDILSSRRFINSVSSFKKRSKITPTNKFHGNKVTQWINISSSFKLFATLDTPNSQVRSKEHNDLLGKIKGTDDCSKHGSLTSTEKLWKSVISTPEKWYDLRLNKKKQKAPDFKHIDTGEALCIDSINTPAWALSKLRDMGTEAFAHFLSIDDLWKSLFADPSVWLDERKTKKSNKHPDFVHKKTRQALWIDDQRIPAWVKPMLSNLQDTASATSFIELWKAFFADPSKWFDDRKSKKTNKHPDFKHKDTGEGLWINHNRTPIWVTHKLNNLQDEAFATSPPKDDLWKSLFADPSKWVDHRKFKKNNKHPDFKHKDTDEPLWIDGMRTPAWVAPMLINLQDEAFASMDGVFASSETKWKDLLASPSKWYDNRTCKRTPKAPDFRSVDTSEALWIDEPMPTWILSELSKLGNDAFANSSVKGSSCKNVSADAFTLLDS